MVYDGTACATALIKIYLPTLVKTFSFHPDTLQATLCFMCAKVLDFDLPTREGKPRYDSWGLITWAPNKVFTPSLIPSSVLGLKKREVFFLFSCWPDEAL